MQATAELAFAAISADGGGPGYFSTVYMPAEQPRPQFVVHRLLLDSRDATAGANSFSCSFDLEQSAQGGFVSVVSAELKGAAVPKSDGENYCIVDVRQLNDDQLAATNSAAHNTFAVLFYDTSAITPGTVKPLRGADFYQKVIRFRPAINRLDRLDVQLKNWDGSVMTSANVGGTANVQFQLLMELVCLNNRRY